MAEEHVAVCLLKRTALLAVCLVLGATFVFGVFFVLPGDPVHNFIPKGTNPEVWQRIVEELKLNEPIPVQYVNFMVKMFTGDFPTSTGYLKGYDIGSFIYPYISATLILYSLTAVIGCLLGAFIEQAISRLRNPPLRVASHGLAFLIFVAPVGGLSLLLLMLIATFDLPFPLRGGTLIPLLAGVIATCAGYILIARRPSEERPVGLRGTMVGAANRTLDLLLMPERRAVLFALSAWIMTTTLVIEFVFSRRGLGLLFFDSISRYDAPLAMSVAFVAVTLMMVIQFVVDVASGLLSRKARAEQKQPDRRIEPLPTTNSEAVLPERTVRTNVRRSGLFRPLLVGLTSSWRGRVAIGLLLAMIVVGAAAPILSTVDNPGHLTSREPNRGEYDSNTGMYIWQWENPHAPTLDRSPYSGYLHPLGTDSYGRDIYSVVIYGLRDELAIAAFVASTALLVGFANSILAYAMRGTPGFLRLLVRGGASALSWTLIGIPLLGGLGIVMMIRGPEFWIGPILALVIMWMWATHSLSLLGGSGRTAVAADAVGRSLTDSLRTNMSRILHISKQAFLIAYLSFTVVAFIGLAGAEQFYWSSLLESAWENDAILLGAWWWVLPPIVATMLLCVAIYVILDTMEKTADVIIREENEPGVEESTEADPLLE